MTAFVAQEPGQLALLAARIVAFAVVAVSVRPSGFARVIALGIAVASFLASLAWSGLWPVEVVACVGASLRYGGDALPAPWRWGSLGVVAALAVLSRAPGRSVASPPDDPSSAVAYWSARGNLFRARSAALAWAERESPPAEGYVSLAMVDWALGDRVRARRVLAKVLAGAAGPATHAHASELDARWRAEAP